MTEEEREALSSGIRVLAGSPTPQELAALTAVLGAALDDFAASERRIADGAPSGWRRSQLALRGPLPYRDWQRSGWL